MDNDGVYRGPPRGMDKDVMLTIEEAAGTCRISTRTILRRLQSGELRCFRSGRVVRIWRSDILRMLDQDATTKINDTTSSKTPDPSFS